jgi:hypothetical protein
MTDGSAAERVRIAGPADEDDLVDLCRLRHRETAMPGADGHPAPLAVEKVRATLQRAIMPNRNDPDAGQAWIGAIGQRGNMEAAAYLTVTSPWDQDALYLMVLWNFVAPDYRKTTHATELLTFATAFSRVLNMPLALESTQHEPAKSRIIERNLSCKPFGHFYLITPDTAAIGAQ